MTHPRKVRNIKFEIGSHVDQFVMGDPRQSPLVSVVVPTRNRIDEVRRCLTSVLRSDYAEIELIVVDDASREPVESALVGMFPQAKFVRNEQRAFLSCCRNLGANVAAGDYLFFLDDDNVLAPEAIRALVRPLAGSDKVAVSSPVIYYLAEPEKVWTSRIVRGRFPGFYTLSTDIPQGCTETFSFHNSFMVKRTVFGELDGFDCLNFPVRFSELDFAHKLRSRGYSALVNPQAKVWHDIGWALTHIDSARAYYTERNRILLLKRYYSRGEFRFYVVCILPFLGLYYLIHHSLSSSDAPAKTAANLVRGIVDGLRVPTEENRG